MNIKMSEFLRGWLFVVTVIAVSGLMSSAYIAYKAHQLKQATDLSLAATATKGAGELIAAALPPGPEGERTRAMLSLLLSGSEHTEQWLRQQVASHYDHTVRALVIWSFLVLALAGAVRKHFASRAQSS